MSRKTKRAGLILVLLLAVAAGGSAIRRLGETAIGSNRSFQGPFYALRMGTHRDRVIAQLGAPLAHYSARVDHGQHEGLEREDERAGRRGATYFLVWSSGRGSTCTLGFDDHDLLVERACVRNVKSVPRGA